MRFSALTPVAIGLISGFAFLPSAVVFGQMATDPVLATVGSTEIRASEVDAAAQGRLQAIRAQEYAARKSALDVLIRRTLLANAARNRSLSVDELLKIEIDAHVPD